MRKPLCASGGEAQAAASPRMALGVGGSAEGRRGRLEA